MASFLQSLDVSLFRLINGRWTSDFMDVAMAYVSDFGFWMWPLAGVAVTLLVLGGFREKLLVALTAVMLLVGDAGIVQGMREVINRPRPWQALEDVRFVSLSGVEMRGPTPYVKGRSMPSGHVSNHTAICVLLLRLYGPWAGLFFAWIPVIAYSRIYTGSHYPWDVVVSFMLAFAYAWLIFNVMHRLWKKLGPQYWPELYEQYPDWEALWRKKK